MSFTGSEGSAINPNTAAEWTATYRGNHADETYAHFLGKDILNTILGQPGCMGIRFYYGTNGSGPQLVAVGANKDEDDQLTGESIVADDCVKAPPRSGALNILNS